MDLLLGILIMLKNLERYIYMYLYQYPKGNNQFTIAKDLLLLMGDDENQSYFRGDLFVDNTGIFNFYLTNDDQYNKDQLLKNSPDFFEFFNNKVKPKVDQLFPKLKQFDFSSAEDWAEIINQNFDIKESDDLLKTYARNSPEIVSMSFPHTNSEIKKSPHYSYGLKIYNRFDFSPDINNESELIKFTEMFFTTMIDVYKTRSEKSKLLPNNIKKLLIKRIFHFEVLHNSVFNLAVPLPVDEPVKAYTEQELEQQKIWAEEFEIWWNEEGQYHRAGGGDYEKTFAWWAWLNREESKSKKVMHLLQKIEKLELLLQ